MKSVRVEDAVGMVLAHDLTKIVPGVFKGAAYKKGHIINQEDIEELKRMGKNHLFVLELDENTLHEDDAAARIAGAAAGDNIILEGPSEGKISFKAEKKGLLKINVEALNEINDIEDIIISTLHDNSVVEKGKTVAGTRIIPLTTEKGKVEKVEGICGRLGKIIWVKELVQRKVGVVVTGTEVFEGRITDKFGPVLRNKVMESGCLLTGIKYAPDNKDMIKDAIEAQIQGGAEIVLVSGGMSVDADDVTPKAIREVSGRVITYGAPVLPGAMFMLAYRGNTPVIGVPACGMYHKITIFDIIFPRILAGEEVNRRDITRLGHGGLCQNCSSCSYPNCAFGK
ncbi:MAG: molybdopterin-binding protein [Caulobacteraceae bacterium]